VSIWIRHAGWRFVVPAALLLWALAAAGGELLLPSLLVALPVTSLLTVVDRPFPALVAAFLPLMLSGALPQPLPEDPFLAMLVYACFLVGRFAPLARQPWAAAAVLVLLSANLLEPGRDVVAADAVFPVLLTAGPWLLGLAVQLARARERAALVFAEDVAASRSRDVRLATVEERLRIARELHDVLAHDLSSVSLLAQVSRRDLEDGRPIEADALREIEHLAQQSLVEVRRVLGVLRHSDVPDPLAPFPTVEGIAALVEAARASGQEVRLRVDGAPRRLPPALGQTAYRIVQEALTNARRHGGRGRTDVAVRWRSESILLEVSNPVRTPAGADVDPVDGHGLAGIRERAHLFGGTTSIGHRDGRWLVSAELPAPLVTEREPV
jgi:signal transduction histidine kinase